MLYQMHEFQRALLSPLTAWAQAASKSFANPSSPLSLMPGATRWSAAYELMYRLGKDYEKPEFNLHQIEKDGHHIPIVEQTVIEKPFCRLRRFKRFADDSVAVGQLKEEPVVLVCAPLSGHHATLLRDTVRTLLQDHKVYITDWIDARMVPVETGPFHLDDYVDYIQDFIRHIGARNLHVISVCQPTVPVLAAISLMASRGEDTPLTMTMMGGPIDARKSPTSVNSLATNHSLAWFENNVIHTVPANYPGEGRQVYPGFLQHTGFVAMNPERHAQSHWDFYQSLMRGDEEDAEAHRRFYDEYNAVLDMAAEYYLDTIRLVFQEFGLAEGTWDVRGERVKPADISQTALMTIEGELDDISGSGQTHVAQELCTGIPDEHRRSLTAEKCGHYGIFSGRRWRTIIYPQLREFIREHQPASKTPAGAAPVAPGNDDAISVTASQAAASPAVSAAAQDAAAGTAHAAPAKAAQRTTPKRSAAGSRRSPAQPATSTKPAAKKAVAPKASPARSPRARKTV
ncbi:polyhydroxyalkanoate depolymerase [Burkholderia sp. 22PA0099]|uniref:polyhydroxyalkanoate depolymerase n=1 Tax=Burkholderia sp. 22PA0099 TaxID=3237372 RepID=UPI0039C0CC8E